MLAAALAFYPINNRPFSYFLEAMWNYSTSKKLYLWQRSSDVVYKELEATSEPVVPIAPTQRGSSHPSITSLTRSLELQALQKPE